MDWAQEARWAQGPGPLGLGARARAPPGPSPLHKQNLRSCSSFFLKNAPLENHEKTTFRAFLETKGPPDPPWVQERQILFRIALTRALYDQMPPQLCLLYVPGQPSKRILKTTTKNMVWQLRKHRPDKRNSPIGPICIRFLYKINWNLPFIRTVLFI